MKRLTLLFSLICLPFLINASDLGKHKKPKATKDANVLDVTKNQGTFLEYETPEELKAEFEKEASLKMYSAEMRLSEFESLPKGGQLILTYSRMDIESANSKWFTIIAQDTQGKEVFRQQLDSKVPENIDGGSVSYWKNIRVIPVTTLLETGTKVFVIDGAKNNRHEYLIQH